MVMGLFSGSKGKTAKGPAAIDEPAILKSLSQVIDPDLNKDIVSLGFVRNLEITPSAKGSQVRFDVNLTTPACPVKEELRQACIDVVSQLPGVDTVDVNMTAVQPKRPVTESGKIPALADVQNIIAVAAGKGGVGKSTVAVNLAFALAKSGAKVGLLDADIYGPSIPTMVQIDTPPAGQGNTILPPSAQGVKVVSMAFFSEDPTKAAILRGPMAGNVVKQFLTQVQWGELDYLIVDYPPGTGDIQLTISQTASVTGAVIVTTPQEVALIDVRKAMQMFQTVKVPILGVIETMSYFQPPGSEDKHYIFGRDGGEKIARENGVTFLGGIPIDPELAKGGDYGRPATLHEPDGLSAQAFMTAAGQLARQTSILNSGNSGASGGLDQFAFDWQKEV